MTGHTPCPDCGDRGTCDACRIAGTGLRAELAAALSIPRPLTPDEERAYLRARPIYSTETVDMFEGIALDSTPARPKAGGQFPLLLGGES